MNTHKDDILQRLIEHVCNECSTIDIEARYNECLDECFSFESVGGPFEHMQPSAVLLACDPTAYRCGRNDWLDSERAFITEIDGDYYEIHDVEEARQSFVDSLTDEMNALENELEDLREQADDGERDEEQESRLEADIEELRADIAACEKYAW